MQGWIKVHRSICDHWLWQDKPFAKGQAFEDILYHSSHANNKVLIDGKLIDIKRGEEITSIRKLSNRWGWSNTKVKNFLELLEKEKMISLEKSDSQKTVIKVLNYAKYQECNTYDSDSEATIERQPSDSEATIKHTNKNVKNVNNEKNVKNSTTISNEIVCQTETVRLDVQPIIEAWNALSNGSAIKPISKLTPASKRYQSLVARIKEYSVDDVLKAIENVSQSKFLKGDNNQSWIITFDWLVRPNNFPKVLEGNYSKRTEDKPIGNRNSTNEFMAKLASMRE